MKKLIIASVVAATLVLAACKDEAKQKANEVVDKVGTKIEEILEKITEGGSKNEEYKAQVQASFTAFKNDCASEGGKLSRKPEGRTPGIVCTTPDGTVVEFKFDPPSTPNVN